MKEKNIEGNMVGEGLILGGVLVVDRTGRVTYSYPEQTGSPAPVEAIEADDAADAAADEFDDVLAELDAWDDDPWENAFGGAEPG